MNLNDLYETRDSRDAYQRAVDNSTSGFGKNSYAYQMDGGGNDESHELDPTDWYVVKDGKMFKATVYPNQEQQAISLGYSRTRDEAKAKADQQGVAESDDYSAVTGAITRRIITQHPDLLQKFGPVAVTQAIDDVADFVGDVEEIGSSDVSGWVRQVVQSLGQQDVAEGYYDLNDEGMQPIDLSSKPSFKQIVNRYTQLVYQGHAGETSPEEDQEYDAIEQYVAKRFGEKGSAHLQKAGEVSYWGRDDKPYGRDSRSSNLGWPSMPGSNFRTTKAGKMHKQDAGSKKHIIGNRLGSHPAPTLPESDVDSDGYSVDHADSGEYDYEGDQAKDQLNTIVRAARRLNGMLDDNENMPEWVQMKITNAADYIDTAADYIESNQEPELDEDIGQQLNIQQLATISDEALDKAYGYGRSQPGNSFGWQANLKSAAFAKQMIDKGVTDIDAISDAIHKGWNTTAQAFVQNPEQFDDTAKLKAAGKLEAKLQQRAQLMKQNYGQLPEEEKEKDRVVARALLQALKGEQGVAEGSEQIDELSTGTLNSYANKARAQVRASPGANPNNSHLPTDPKIANRARGAVKADNRLNGFGPVKKSTQGVAEGADDKFSVADKVEQLVDQYRLYDKRGWTDLFAKLAGRKLAGAEIYREMEYASKFLQLLDSIKMRSDYRGQQDPRKDQELIDLSNQWLDLFNTATGEYKAMSGQGVAEGEKVGNMDADRFDAALARMKQLAGSGPLKTVWDPEKRVYRNIPVAVQPKK